MTKRERTVAFMHELSTYVNQIREMEAQRDRLKANINMAEAVNDVKQMQQFTENKIRLLEMLEKLTPIATSVANRSTVEGAEKLVREIEVRLNEAAKYEQSFLTIQAQMELAATLGEFASEAGAQTRVEVEEAVSTARSRVEKQIDLAWDLVPNKAVVLDLGAK